MATSVAEMVSTQPTSPPWRPTSNSANVTLAVTNVVSEPLALRALRRIYCAYLHHSHHRFLCPRVGRWIDRCYKVMNPGMDPFARVKTQLN